MLGSTTKRIGVGLTLALALAFTVGGFNVRPAVADDVRVVFDKILQDPGNIDLNLRYAKLTIAQGELRKALAAYERILAKHPDNAAAKAGIARVRQLLKPNFTVINAVTGGNYESNPSRLSNRGTVTHDGVFFGRFVMLDERRVGARRWRTLGDVYANAHINIRSLDYGAVSGATGPIFPILNGWQAHTFVRGGYSWYDGRSFQGLVGGGATFEPVLPGTSMLRAITAKIDYNFIGNSFSSRNAYVFELNARFIKFNLLDRRGIGTLTPYYRYNGVSGSGGTFIDPSGEQYPLTYHQLGIRADYFFNFWKNLTINTNITMEYKHYFEEVFFEQKHRRDFIVAPGVELIVAGLISGKADLIFSYRFEYNSSNDGYQRYTNQIAGVRVLWRIR